VPAPSQENAFGPAPSERSFSEDAALIQRELWIRLVALPAALGVAWALMRTPFGRPLFRTFVTMLVHETGHAVTAWLCGYAAFPSLWITHIYGRSAFVTLVIAGALGYGAWWSWKQRRLRLAAAFAVVLLFQLVCTLGLSEERHMMLFSFGGDAGKLVLGSVLMALIYVDIGSPLHQHQVRWGFLAIGALAFMDAFEEWWGCRSDVDRLPIGEIEGVGLSDAASLLENHLWSVTQLVHRYTTLGLVCLAGLALLYAVQLREAYAQARVMEAHRARASR